MSNSQVLGGKSSSGWQRHQLVGSRGFTPTNVSGTIDNDKMAVWYSTTAYIDSNDELWTYLVHDLDVEFCVDQKHVSWKITHVLCKIATGNFLTLECWETLWCQ